MEDQVPENWILITKYLKGEISEEEKNVLFRWLEEKPENQATYDQLKELWAITSLPENSYEPDVDTGWQEFKAKTAREEVSPKEQETFSVIQFVRTTAFMKIAAVFILLAGLGYIASRFTGSEDPATAAVTLPSNSKPYAIEYATLAREEREVVLPDSSRILLKENTSLLFSSTFNTDNRVVTLSGEAFFDIRKANGRKFTIYSGNALTQVLGTSFTIRAYSYEKEVTLKVLTGKVAFSSVKDSSNKIYLLPGDQANLDASQTLAMIKQRQPEEKKLAGIEFSNTRLEDVFSQLEENYGVTIKISDADLSNCHFTGTFTNADVEKIIKALSVSLNLSYTRNRNEFFMKGSGCK